MTRKTAKVGGAVTQYEYDAENKLVRVGTGAKTVNYKYDGLGRRVEKEVIDAGTATTRYLYDNEDILLELNGANGIVARYTHGPGIDEPLIIEKNASRFSTMPMAWARSLKSPTKAAPWSSATRIRRSARSSLKSDPSFVQPYTFTSEGVRCGDRALFLPGTHL